jgi:hypothetical protein
MFSAHNQMRKWLDHMRIVFPLFFQSGWRSLTVHWQVNKPSTQHYSRTASCQKSRKRILHRTTVPRSKEELTPRKVEVDILEWWKINSIKYPVLSKMARDILAIPASTIPSESAFSTGGRVISDYRGSLACSTVEALVCLQDWLKAACTYFLSLSFLGS